MTDFAEWWVYDALTAVGVAQCVATIRSVYSKHSNISSIVT